MANEINNTVSPTISATVSSTIISCIPKTIADHIANTSNPHNVTCSQIGAMPYDANIVSDANYTHTDNNFNNTYKGSLDSLSTTYATNTALSELQTQVNSMQSNVSSITSIGSSNSSNLSTIQSDVSGIKTKINSIENSITSVSTTSSSNAGKITTIENSIVEMTNSINSNATNISSLSSGKVDKVDGKGLSTEDFTTELKTKLVGLNASGTSGGGGITIVQKNYLYNQQFNINQRSKSSYPIGTAKSYCLDRWQKDPDVVVTYASKQNIATVSNMSTTTMEGICQFIFDHSNLLGKQVTFCLKTSTGTYTLTSDALPTDPETTSQNTILKTVSTDFGALQLEFATKHFCIKILLNPATSETEYTTITPKSAKLEEGTAYTGLTLNTRVIDSDECRHFYQKLSCRSAYATGFIGYYPSKTEYNLIFPLNTNLYMTSLTFVKDSTSNNPKIYKLNGETLTLTDYRTFTAKYKDADRTFLHMYIDYAVDNTEMLGDSAKKLEFCFGQLPGFAVDAEITS